MNDNHNPYKSQIERMSDSFPVKVVKKAKLSGRERKKFDLENIQFLEGLRKAGQLKKAVDLKYLQQLKDKYHVD
ncbi:MAG TPA: hypothetical protein DDW71_00495 [Lactobacillus sp.]|nr:hypothetical protein [Lactobacillus sp.]